MRLCIYYSKKQQPEIYEIITVRKLYAPGVIATKNDQITNYKQTISALFNTQVFLRLFRAVQILIKMIDGAPAVLWSLGVGSSPSPEPRQRNGAAVPQLEFMNSRSSRTRMTMFNNCDHLLFPEIVLFISLIVRTALKAITVRMYYMYLIQILDCIQI